MSPAADTSDITMMQRAMDLARQAAAIGEVPVGAVVYRFGVDGSVEVLGEGYNRREIDHDPTAHAELLAIRAAAATLGDWRLENCSLAVTLEPCPMCAGLIVNARIARVVYGADDPKAGACRSLFALTTDARLNHRVELLPGVLGDESAALLKEILPHAQKEVVPALWPAACPQFPRHASLPRLSPYDYRRLAVTGTIGIDTIEAPTGRAEEVLGGSCTYFSAAASFYCPVRLVAAVGDDFPASGHAAFKRFPAIDTAGLEVRQGSKTFRWGGKYRADMNSRDTLFTELGVLAEKPPTVPQKFRDSPLVFLANSHPGVQAELLSAFTARKLAVADTMDLWINNARQELLRLLKQVDGVVLNYDEAELFTGKRNPVTAAKHILEMGPRFTVIKKGEHGAILVHRDGVCSLPAYPTEMVVDPTGCGDTFAGGMMGALSASNASDPGSFENVRRAIVHGTVIASYTIEAFSLDRLVKLTKNEIDARYNEYVSMVRV